MTRKAAVVGGAGFAGIELVRLLLRHPDFELVAVTSDNNAGRPIAEMYPSFTGQCDLAFSATSEARLEEMDAVFLAVPHTGALEHAPALVAAGVAVFDLSADFRLSDASVYEEYYGVTHTSPELLAERAFGQPELFSEGLARLAASREEQKGVLVACAGCYPTATSLAAAPAVRAGLAAEEAHIVVDAISGVTGAGKKATERTHFCFADENLEAYSVAAHRHLPEIEQILGIQGEGRLVFTPHLAPLNRGLLSTVTIPIAKNVSADLDEPDARFASTASFLDLYREFYEGSTFVEVLPEGRQPRTSSVVGSNNAQIGLAFDKRAGVLIATCAIDNLCKGAAGQAIQCANIVFGLPEGAGLDGLALPV